MTNKKLWLSLLAVVLIVCMLSVGLMSCKKKVDEEEEEEEEEITVEEQAATAIIEGIQKSLKAADMTDLKVDGEVGLTVGDKEYKLKLALDLDLLQYNGWKYTNCTTSDTYNSKEKYFTKDAESEEDEYVEEKEMTEEKFNNAKTTFYTREKKGKETSTKSNTFLNAELIDVKDDNNVLLGVYYWDAQSNVAEANAFDQNKVYVQFYDKDAGETKKMVFPAPYVNATMKAMNAYVDFHGIKVDELDFWDTLGGILPVIASLADKSKTEYVENQKASITINLAAVLNNFSSVLSSANSFVEPLGLNINLSDLGSILPAISITLAATFDSTGMTTGVDLSLNIEEKDMEIKKVKNGQEGETFLKIDMDKDVKVGLSLDYKVGEVEAFYPDDLASYEIRANIVDVELSADLFISEQISLDLNDTMSISVPGGDYTLSLYAALNPFVIMDDIKAGLNFDGVSNIIATIKNLLDAVAGVEINLVRTHDEKHVKLAENTTVLKVVISEKYKSSGSKESGKSATISTTVLSGADITVPGLPIDSAITTVQGVLDKLIDPDDESPSTAEGEEDKITPILTIVGKYLAGAYIGINDGEHEDIFASFDTSKTEYGVIPFSGYTEYKGDIADAGDFKFYQRTAAPSGMQPYTGTYDATKTYYTRVGDYYRQVDKTKEAFNKYRKYYTRSGEGTDEEPYEYTYVKNIKESDYTGSTVYYVYVKEGFKQANISAFAQGVTYYVDVASTYVEVAKADAAAAQAKYKTDKAAWDVLTDEEKEDVEHHPEPVKPVYYVKGLNETGGDFGMGLLDASLAIDFDDDDNISIAIGGTITNLGFFGLSNSLSVSIKNLSVKLWQNDYPIHIGTKAGHLSDLTKSA